MITEPGQEIAWGELHVGSRSIFAAAGFTEVSRPTPRRVVMRIDFLASRFRHSYPFPATHEPGRATSARSTTFPRPAHRA
jgi:hypothetical protein